MSKAPIIAVLAFVLSGQALAVEPLRPHARLPQRSDHYTCYEVDARKGWQRIDTSGLSEPVMFYFDPDNQDIQQSEGLGPVHGWSVDAARYANVGIFGHSGADAAALEPFSAYKYDRKQAFGALLLRNDAGQILVPKSTRHAHKHPWAAHVDYRINDTDAGLGDNAGHVMVCIADSRDFD